MNCQDLTQLLDDGDIRNVSPAKRRELDAHLSGCADCAAEWRVQERIVMAPALRVPAGFVAQCRQLVAANVVRLVPRRVILYSTLLVLAAAAAILGWHMLPAPEGAAAIVSVPAIAAPEQTPAQVQAEPESKPALESVRPQPVAPPAGEYTVVVRPLRIEGDDTQGNVMAARFRDRVITLLQGVPNLVLVDAQPGADTAVADFELRMTFTGMLPTLRTVTLEVGKSAEFAATESAIAAEAMMPPAEQARSRLSRQLADSQKLTGVLRGGNTGLSLLLGAPSPTTAILDDATTQPNGRVDNAAQQLVRELRVKILPLDSAFEQQMLATLGNPAQRYAVRRTALGALLWYAERRGGFSHASPAVVRAGGEFALTAASDLEFERPVVWDGLALTASPELVPYLIRGLNEDAQTETRLQLVKILAETYRDDPRAQAALVAAAKSNDQETVRMAAMRGSGESRWREYVVATLGNPTLSDLQRLQPIADMAPGEAGTLGTSPKTKMVLEAHQLRELGALLIKVAPDRTASEIARKALFAAGAMETPAALDMLIEVADALRAENFGRGMEGVAVMGLRQTAHSLISMRYASDPKARPVIEGIARNGDPLEKMIAESQLRIIDMKTSMETARPNQPPAQ